MLVFGKLTTYFVERKKNEAAKRLYTQELTVKIRTYAQNQSPTWLITLQHLNETSAKNLTLILFFSIARNQPYDPTCPISKDEWKNLIRKECSNYAKTIAK